MRSMGTLLTVRWGSAGRTGAGGATSELVGSRLSARSVFVTPQPVRTAVTAATTTILVRWLIVIGSGPGDVLCAHV